MDAGRWHKSLGSDNLEQRTDSALLTRCVETWDPGKSSHDSDIVMWHNEI